ncbi:MAG: peptidoglycan-binding protein [Candidatus Pacebacteria bacterium]|nr:peptidoglycan-binding protein [Candidatus Paceibacterota bacterium]
MQKRKIFIISASSVVFIFIISILLNFFIFSEKNVKAQSSIPSDCDLKTFKSTDSDKPPFPSFCNRYASIGNCTEKVSGTPTTSCPYCNSWKIGNETGKEIACDLELQKNIADNGGDPCNIDYGKCKTGNVWKCDSNIGYGDKRNCEVYTLQFYLKKLGIYGGPITGVYDRNLCNAIKEFQRQHGIQQTGAVGETTIKGTEGNNYMGMWNVCLENLSPDLCCKIFLSKDMPPPIEPGEQTPGDSQCLGRCDQHLVPCSMTNNPGPKCNLCYLFKLIQNIICYLTWCIAGPLAVISILIAGIMYLTARGNPSQISLAKDIIRATVLGLVIVFGAWIIVNTIITLLGVGSPYSDWSHIDCTL